MYTSGAYQLTTSTDLINFSVVTNPVSFDFTPRHGTVIPVTAAEKQALIRKWNTTAIEPNIISTASVSIYPNPLKGMLHVSFTGNDMNVKVSVLDLNGRVLIEKILSKNSGQIDVSGLQAGIYVLKTTTSNSKSEYTKFIIK